MNTAAPPGHRFLVEMPGESTRQVELSSFPVRIGRHHGCELPLKSWRVARCHATLHLRAGTLMLVDEGSLGGTWVNGERIAEFGPLQTHDEIQIAGYRIRLADPDPGPDLNRSAKDVARSGPALAAGAPASAHDAAPIRWRRRLHAELLSRLDLRRHEIRHLDRDQLKVHVSELLSALINEYPDLHREGLAQALHSSVLDEAIGLGVLEPLLADADVTEIMVNGTAPVFVERGGRLEQTTLRFSSEDAIRSVIERIVIPVGRRIDDGSPMVDARLPDGSRVNAIIPPLALQGPVLTIRRFSAKVFEPSDLVSLGSASPAMIRFLTWCVAQRRNIVVAGGTGSGKTTLLNVLARHIPSDERVITIEDAAELRLVHRNLVSLEARPANAEDRGAVSIRDLVRNALRMRPDRIVIGECRGGEALDMLQAMNTGHEGSLTTVHANSARDALARLEVMVLMSGVELPMTAIREQLASAVDLVVHQTRDRFGRRYVTGISEVTGLESGRIQTQELFRGRVTGEGPAEFHDGVAVPAFLDRLEVRGDDAIRSLFTPWSGASRTTRGTARALEGRHE